MPPYECKYSPIANTVLMWRHRQISLVHMSRILRDADQALKNMCLVMCNGLVKEYCALTSELVITKTASIILFAVNPLRLAC